MQSPEIPLPTATAILDLWVLNSEDSRISLRRTMFIDSFSTSMPTAAFPGIGASIRMLLAFKFRAISSERRTILATLTPAFGWISYRVTVGPFTTFKTVALTPKLASVSSRIFAFAWSVVFSVPPFVAVGFLSKSIDGNLYLIEAGLVLPLSQKGLCPYL